ncbi:hypothetical protein HZS_958 [Henneguya salminicola]|nr:hypothetical protein HZS_958 [Henneguya salminicola]
MEIFSKPFIWLSNNLLKKAKFLLGFGNVNFYHSIQDFYDKYLKEVYSIPRHSPFLNPCDEIFRQLRSKSQRDFIHNLQPIYYDRLGIHDVILLLTTSQAIL